MEKSTFSHLKNYDILVDMQTNFQKRDLKNSRFRGHDFGGSTRGWRGLQGLQGLTVAKASSAHMALQVSDPISPGMSWTVGQMRVVLP